MKSGKIFQRSLRNQHGGAVVETAIMSLIMVPLVIYSIFFYEFAMINLKTSEAARYAAWEMTAMQMSDYVNYKHEKNGYLSSRMSNLVQEVKERWGDDMNSATAKADSNIYKNANKTLFNEKQTGLVVTKFDSGDNDSDGAFMTVNITDSSPYDSSPATEKPDDAVEPSSGNDTLGVGDTITNAIGSGSKKAFKYFHLNVNGFVSTEVSVKMKFSHTAPIYHGDGMLVDSSGNPTATLPPLKAKEKLVADAWDLKNGGDADFGQEHAGKKHEYLNQVSKMVFIGLTDLINSKLNGGLDKFNRVLDKLGLRNPMAAVVRSYAMKHVNASGSHGDSSIEFGDKRIDPFSGNKGRAPSKFYTNTFKDTWNKEDSYYYKVYKNQSPSGQSASSASTGYYMGCDKPQIVHRSNCWK